MDWIKGLLSCIGHIGLWCVVFNRIHATAWPRPSRKATEKAIILAVIFPFVWMVTMGVLERSFSMATIEKHVLAYSYFLACMLLGLGFVGLWIWRKCLIRLPASVMETSTEWIDIQSEIGKPVFHGTWAKLLGSIPFNEARHLTRQRMILGLDIPTQFDGLKICQLSDLHFTGQMGIEYFQQIVEEANQFEADLVVITGDLVDKAKCLPWLESTLGNLKSKLGVFYVLGNHDRRINSEPELRAHLKRIGLIQASQRWHEVDYNGAPIRITGNELPWYRDADSIPPTQPHDAELRILLSHSPDQLEWAQARSFHLMFAGHTHGGQIAFPVIGPIVAPSKYGVKYASGTFQFDDLLMHVSRGISGDEPIRICSPPELGLFTIRSTRA